MIIFELFEFDHFHYEVHSKNPKKLNGWPNIFGVHIIRPGNLNKNFAKTDPLFIMH